MTATAHPTSVELVRPVGEGCVALPPQSFKSLPGVGLTDGRRRAISGA